MKTITLISSLIILQSADAGNTCANYIFDEWPDSRYTIETISGDNVVTDNKTELMWKQCSEGLSGVDCMTGNESLHTWTEVLTLPVALNNNSGFAGYNNWRVPNIQELRSILAINCDNPAINETAFPNTANIWYWSSSPTASPDNSAWYITFGEGYDGYGVLDNAHRVRLVRTVQ